MSSEAFELANSAGELKEISEFLPIVGVLLAAFFGIREWRASALEKNWEFSTELEKEWNDAELKESRAAVARYCLLHSVSGKAVDLNSPLISNNAEKILDFFENVGFLVKKGAIKTEFAWILFHQMIKMYQPHLNTVVEHWRNSGDTYDPTYYDQYEYLYRTLDWEQFKQAESTLKYLWSRILNKNIQDDEVYELNDELLIDIRRARFGDIDELWELEKVCFEPEAGRFEKDEIEGWLEKASASFFVVESVEKDVIAYGLYSEFDEDVPEAEIQHHDGVKTAEIISIAVHPYFRGLGIGTKLLEMIEHLALQNGCSRFLLEVGVGNGPALSHYEKQGYLPVKKLDDYYQAGKDAYAMEKSSSNVTLHKLATEADGGEE